MDPNDRDLLATAAGMALSYAGSVDDRPTTPSPQALAALTAFDEPLSDGGRDPADTLRLLDDVGSPATVASTGGRYFGFVTGATYPVGAGQRLAGERVGPERRAARHVAGGRPPARRRAGMAGRRAAAARGDGAGVRHGRDGGQRLLPGRRARRAAGPAGLGRAGRRAVRRTAVPGGDRRAGALDAVQVARAGRARPRHGCTWCPPTTRAGCAPTGCPTSTGRCWSARRPARSTPARSTRSTRSPTGWPNGAVGCTSTGRSGCGPCADPSAGRARRRPGPGRLVGDRRAQVAQRHLRLRHGLRARPRRPAAHVRRDRGLPARERPVRGDAPHAAVVAAGPAGRGVGRAAHARAPRRRRAGRAGAARRPGRSPTRWPRAG